MRVLFISGREPTYIRNSIIINGLKKNGTDVIECTDHSRSYAIRYPKVLIKYLLKQNELFDFIIIGFLGQPLVLIIKKLTKKPIILDAFISVYDTMCFDRKRFAPKSIFGKIFFWLDKSSCELSDKVLLDTNAHIDYFSETFDIPREKFHRIFVGADEIKFFPHNDEMPKQKFKVFYYGSYLPLHGIEYIVKAAKLLESYNNIEFIIVGKGSERNKINRLVNKLDIKNICFIDWIPYLELPDEIAKADICIGGHFSNIDKAKRVIAGKTFQFIAMKKPVIVGDNPANRELFENKKNALIVDMANADALADAILELKDNNILREKIAEEAYEIFTEKCTPQVIGRDIVEILEASKLWKQL